MTMLKAITRIRAQRPLNALAALLLSVGAALGTAPTTADGSIYVSDSIGYTGGPNVGKYNLDGTPLNATLVTGLSQPYGIALSPDGMSLFVAELGSARVGKYNAVTGAAINASFISGGFQPFGVALSGDGTSLFVTTYGSGKVGKYNAATGAVINASLISGLQVPTGIAVSGSNLYVMDRNAGTIGKYTTNGAVVNASLVSGLIGSQGIAVSADGMSLFVTDFTSFDSVGSESTTPSPAPR